MSLDALRKLIPPPAEPVEPGNKKNWARVEKQLGTKLPDDYKGLVDLYGSGTLAGFYHIFNPFCSESNANLLHRFRSDAKQLAEGHADEPDNYPYPPFPEVPGLIPWACDDNGHTYFWLVERKKKPNDWTVVIDEHDGFGDFAGGLTAYLAAVFEGKIEAMASGFPQPGDLRFVQKAVVSIPFKELNEAVCAEDAGKMRELIAAGRADVNAIVWNGMTLLYFAAEFAKTSEVVKILVEAGADVNGISEEGTPLFGAVYGSKPANAKYLVSAGADPNAKNHRGDTPLFAAIINRRDSVLEFLATIPGMLSAKNKAGLTPLALADKQNKAWDKDNPDSADVVILKAADLWGSDIPYAQSWSKRHYGQINLAEFKTFNETAFSKALAERWSNAGLRIESRPKVRETTYFLRAIDGWITLAMDQDSPRLIAYMIDKAALADVTEFFKGLGLA